MYPLRAGSISAAADGFENFGAVVPRLSNREIPISGASFNSSEEGVTAVPCMRCRLGATYAGATWVPPVSSGDGQTPLALAAISSRSGPHSRWRRAATLQAIELAQYLAFA